MVGVRQGIVLIVGTVVACVVAAVVATASAHGQTPPLRISGTQIILTRPIHWQVNSDSLTAEGEQVLEHLRQLLQSTPSIGRIRLEYHADCMGRRHTVAELARQRAARLRQWLIEHGISPSRVEARAVSPRDDAPPHSHAPCHASQRHVEIWITG
jgi:outer membrane protein OmpA-like peptidoglycan-associated protein